MRKLVLIIACLLVAAPAAQADTLVAHEIEKYFYKDGKMEKFEGQYEYSFYVDLEKKTFTRTRVYDYQNRHIRPDETPYEIYGELNSHPGTAARYNLEPLIRAVGKPDEDTVETLIVGSEYVHSLRSTGNTLTITRLKRLS